MKSKQQIRVNIFDKTLNRFIENQDGEILVFDNKIAAKNFLFTLNYKYENLEVNFEFVDIDEHEF